MDTPEQEIVPEPGATRAERTYLQERYYFRYHWVPQRWWARLGPRTQRVVAAGAQRIVRVALRERSVRVQRRPRGFSRGLGIRVRRHPFTAERPCRTGSDWFAMSRAAFDDLLATTDASPELVEYFRRTYLPTESCFHTLMLPDHSAGASLHFFRFAPGSPHPDIIGDADWDELATSDAFFARKFDAADTALLDRIDCQLLGFPSGVPSSGSASADSREA